MTLYRVEYNTSAGKTSCLPVEQEAEALLMAQQINRDPSRQAVVVAFEPKPFTPQPPPRCYKCGTEKTSDLFKGVYCPRCNDWC